jgi:hypothetical protein
VYRYLGSTFLSLFILAVGAQYLSAKSQRTDQIPAPRFVSNPTSQASAEYGVGLNIQSGVAAFSTVPAPIDASEMMRIDGTDVETETFMTHRSVLLGASLLYQHKWSFGLLGSSLWYQKASTLPRLGRGGASYSQIGLGLSQNWNINDSVSLISDVRAKRTTHLPSDSGYFIDAALIGAGVEFDQKNWMVHSVYRMSPVARLGFTQNQTGLKSGSLQGSSTKSSEWETAFQWKLSPVTTLGLSLRLESSIATVTDESAYSSLGLTVSPATDGLLGQSQKFESTVILFNASRMF